MKGLAGRFIEIDRRNTPALEHLAKVEQRRNQVLHCFRQVGFEIAPADNTLFGKEVDENDRQMGHGADTRDRWSGQLADHGSSLDFFESQWCQRHVCLLRSVPAGTRRVLWCLARS